MAPNVPSKPPLRTAALENFDLAAGRNGANSIHLANHELPSPMRRVSAGLRVLGAAARQILWGLLSRSVRIENDRKLSRHSKDEQFELTVGTKE